MNPATVLRVLGPEPWNVAYVEPSFRADDGRYAENPNRMQMHNQYQVILKPDPGNPQELYLGSLEAIGLDLTKHDVRFVEDNWESPALGAWGLGWEVWLDGQEITQFTYFQQAGSLPLDPVSVEITYGLDRIVMYLQNKTQVWDIEVDGKHSFDELYRPAEVENCVYNFELADVERLKQLYDIYQAEAEACIERGLVAPAHDFVLRQSHTFNLLDARGAIGVTERAKFFADMRRQARSVAELYVAQREQEEYPWLKGGARGAEQEAKSEGQPSALDHRQLTIDNRQSFLLELGSEELPPQDVVDGIAQIDATLRTLLDEFKLDYAELRVTGTTRRLVAYVTELAPQQRDEIVEKRGPALDRAYDADGAAYQSRPGLCPRSGLGGRGSGGTRRLSLRRAEGRGPAHGGDPARAMHAICSTGCAGAKPCAGTPATWAIPAPCAGLWRSMATRSSPLPGPMWPAVTLAVGPALRTRPRICRPARLPPLLWRTAKVTSTAVASQGIVLNRDERRELVREMVRSRGRQCQRRDARRRGSAGRSDGPDRSAHCAPGPL